MKWFIVSLALLISACASSTPDPSANSYIRVVGKGNTVKEAREDGFNSAIEIAVGSLLVSDTKVINNQLVRKEIANHSAGYVIDYKVISETQMHDASYLVVLDVKVHTSKIHERMLSTGKSEGNVNGSILYEQYRSYVGSKDSAQQIISSVLNDYPKQAFIVTNPTMNCGNGTHSKFCFKLDRFGNALIEIPYVVRWNYNYLRALNEALAVNSDSGNRGEQFTIMSKKPGSLIGNTTNHNFNDENRFRTIKNRFVGTVYVHANVLDRAGNILYRSCIDVYSVPHVDYKGFIIRGNDFREDVIYVTIDKSDKISRATNIELVISKSGC